MDKVLTGLCVQREAILKFLNCGISGAPVLREDGKLVGVLSESDIITRETGEGLKHIPQVGGL